MPDILDGAASKAALDAQARQLETLDRLAERFGRSISAALASGASGGRELSGVLDRVGTSLTSTLGRLGSSGLGDVLGTALRTAGQSLSEAVSLGSFGGVQPFAAGGVVSAPTFFPLGRGLGLAGEAGPEAILPLARGADGRLGIRSQGSHGAPAPVTVNISTPDADSFRRSEAQVSAALARAVARGRRAL